METIKLEPIWGMEIMGVRRAGTDHALAWLDADGWKVFALAEGRTGEVVASGPETSNVGELIADAMKAAGTWDHRVKEEA